MQGEVWRHVSAQKAEWRPPYIKRDAWPTGNTLRQSERFNYHIFILHQRSLLFANNPTKTQDLHTTLIIFTST